jgi:serine protease AprX
MKASLKYIMIFLSALFFALMPTDEPVRTKYWVFFTDKGPSAHFKTSGNIFFQRSLLSDRSIKRRRKTLGDRPVQVSDLPVLQLYVDRITETGSVQVMTSKWLNGASFLVTGSQLEHVRLLPFVREIRRVAQYRIPQPDAAIVGYPGFLKSNTAIDLPQMYGSSFAQIKTIGALNLHQAKITGKGVLIGILDTGFNLNHDAFEKTGVIAEFDFINLDTITSNEPGQDIAGQESHGTNTLSVIAGYMEGRLIGVAHDARFALAKTEDNSGEQAIEEDYWVAGLEWLDSIGVDIVSSSLGYSQFEDESFYTQADMDGNTAVTTRAADIAASKGILVVNSAGNEGNTSWGIISAPADGDSVLAVGAVNADSTLALFSSRGPTADGRIKPDVAALGVSVLVATAGRPEVYSVVNGTSFSCPLVAGAAALVLSAHPEVPAFQIMTALKETASRSDNPDNFLGYGVINAFAAVSYFGPAFGNVPDIENISEGSKITTKAISSHGVDALTVKLHYTFGAGPSFTTISMMQENDNTFSTVIPAASGQRTRFFMSASDLDGTEASFPEADNIFIFESGSNVIAREKNTGDTIPAVFALSENFPNPFNNSTIITIDLKQDSHTSLIIYNGLGRHVRTLYNGPLIAGIHSISWDGTNDAGTIVSSGIYFYRLRVPRFTKTRKMVMVR